MFFTGETSFYAAAAAEAVDPKAADDRVGKSSICSAAPPTCVMNECEPRAVVRGGGPPRDVAHFPYVTTENFTFCM